MRNYNIYTCTQLVLLNSYYYINEYTVQYNLYISGNPTVLIKYLKGLQPHKVVEIIISCEIVTTRGALLKIIHFKNMYLAIYVIKDKDNTSIN